MGMSLELYQVDAFTDRPFAGNPAAVCLLPEPRDARWMQDVAREMNLSETAFLDPHEGTDGGFNLRWFTPAVEVELCGHATLASAHVLFHELGESADTITFDSASGPLAVTRRPDGKLELDFPVTPVELETDAAVRAA